MEGAAKFCTYFSATVILKALRVGSGCFLADLHCIRPIPKSARRDDPTRLAVLADALEETGSDNADILNHCRVEGPHVRGCWALDLVVGKE